MSCDCIFLILCKFFALFLGFVCVVVMDLYLFWVRVSSLLWVSSRAIDALRTIREIRLISR